MSTYQQQMKEIERRRRMAEALQMQAQGISSPQQSGRIVAGPTWGSSIAGLAAALGGAYQNRKADKMQGEAETAERARLAEAMKRIWAGNGDPGVDPITGQGPAMNAQQQAAIEAFGAMPLDMQQQLVGGQAIKTLFPAEKKQAEGFTLSPGQTRYGGDGKEIASRPVEVKADGGFSLSPGETRYDAAGKQIASSAPKPEKAAARWVSMTPEEITAAGLPAGTGAQRNADTGEINVITKRDNTGTLSQKDATTAKMKLNTVQLARQQLNSIKDAFTQGREGLNAFGPGQGMLPTEAGKLFDSRVDQMRSTLTALTRVPGVGAMSDYETKLDQGKFPARSDYESVTADKIQQLEDMLALIENGYADLLGSGTAQSPSPAPSPAADAGGVATVKSDADFDALPSGAEFVGPDGVRRRKP